MEKIENIINILKTKLQDKDNKDLAKNTLSLTILNAVNFVLPLFTIPLLLNNLGATNYGIVNIYISLYAIFQKVVNYGFEYIGTRDISIAINKNDRNKIFSIVLLCKLINAIIVIILSLFYFCLTGTSNIAIAVIISIELIGTALNMNWLFQGLKQMKVITIITSITKFIYSVLIIVLIKKADDVLIYAALYSFISIGIGLTGLILSIGKKYNFYCTRFSFQNLIGAYVEGWHMFFASLCSGLSTNLCTVILGKLKGEETVAYFSAGFKIVQAISLVFSAITQALYPFSCIKFKGSFTEGKSYVFRFMKPVLCVIGISCLFMMVTSKLIFQFIYDPIYWKYYPIAIIGSIWLFFSFLNNFLGIQILVASNRSSIYRYLFTIATIITIISYYIFIPFIGPYGSISALLLGEIILSIILYSRISKIKEIGTVVM